MTAYREADLTPRVRELEEENARLRKAAAKKPMDPIDTVGMIGLVLLCALLAFGVCMAVRGVWLHFAEAECRYECAEQRGTCDEIAERGFICRKGGSRFTVPRGEP